MFVSTTFELALKHNMSMSVMNVTKNQICQSLVFVKNHIWFLCNRRDVSYVCICEKKEEMRETQDRLDRMENRILKKKVYIHK